MFKFGVNDIVFYGTTGVCRVDGVDDVKLGRETKQYYVLTPVSQGGSTVFVPTDNEVLLSRVRKVLTKSEIQNIISNLPADAEVWSNNPAERVRIYAEVLKSGDRGQILLSVRTLLTHRRALSATGKKLHITDERALRDAQRLLIDEFSYVLGVEPNEAEEYILSNILPEK